MAVDERDIVTTLLRDRAMILARIDAIVRDAHRAEDVLQEVSLAALDKRSEIADADHLRRWLRKVARDKAVDAVRHEARRPVIFSDAVLDLIESDWQAMDTLDAVELHDTLRRCVDTLTPYARDLIRRRYRDELTGPQLAEAMGRPINTVKIALTRAHATLLDCMRRHLEGEGGPA